MTTLAPSAPLADPLDLKAQLLLAGELGNSVASDYRSLDRVWHNLANLHLNTVLVPVYWELLEPHEGQFEFSLLMHLLRLARRHEQRLILLWFGSWKNSMSCYAPAWVKTNVTRFPRARLSSGAPLEILSPFSRENLEADRRAFARLMRYLSEHDQQGTVIAVQVENEIGMLVEARDACEAANKAFAEPVPQEILERLAGESGEAHTTALRRFRENGSRKQGHWVEVFGAGIETDELFMAYHFARYVDEIAKAGKAEHALPLFVNAALNRPGHLPGQYPSAGPLPHLFDLWQMGAPHIDLLVPDIYYPDFENWCHKYQATGQLFIPEATRGAECLVHVLYAIGACGAIGFSPFGIDSLDPSEVPLGQVYEALGELKDAIVSRRNGPGMGAVLLTRDDPKKTLLFDGYRFFFSHDYTWECSGPERFRDEWPKAGALVLQMGKDDFIVLGSGVIVTFEPRDTEASHEQAGILFIDEGTPQNGRFEAGRRLNGDESHQGRHLRIPAPGFGVQRLRLYRYR